MVEGAQIAGSEEDIQGSTQECECRKLRKCALGFLFSYAALISHESDFSMVKERGLLPDVVKWPNWISFIQQLDTEHIYPDTHPRFLHGELRLSRLNILWRLSQNTCYLAYWNQCTTFSRHNFAWLAGTTCLKRLASCSCARKGGAAYQTTSSATR